MDVQRAAGTHWTRFAGVLTMSWAIAGATNATRAERVAKDRMLKGVEWVVGRWGSCGSGRQ